MCTHHMYTHAPTGTYLLLLTWDHLPHSYMHSCTHIYTCTRDERTHTHSPTPMHMGAHSYTLSYTRAHLHKHRPILTHVHTHMHSHMHTHFPTHVPSPMHTCGHSYTLTRPHPGSGPRDAAVTRITGIGCFFPTHVPTIKKTGRDLGPETGRGRGLRAGSWLQPGGHGACVGGTQDRQTDLGDGRWNASKASGPCAHPHHSVRRCHPPVSR